MTTSQMLFLLTSAYTDVTCKYNEGPIKGDSLDGIEDSHTHIHTASFCPCDRAPSPAKMASFMESFTVLLKVRSVILRQVSCAGRCVV